MKTGTGQNHTPTPWITDDRHIHPASGLTYPRGQEPETNVVVLVDTDCHENALLNETDKANLKLIVRAVNCHDQLVEATRLGLRAMRSLGWDEAEKSGPAAQLRQWFDTAYAAWESAEGGTR